MLDLSIIIPTYNDDLSLWKCIEALTPQLIEGVELIVINNSVNSINFELPSAVKVYQELNPGSYAARSYGVEQARGRYYAFTDADCLPHPDWVKTILQQIAEGCQFFIGPVIMTGSRNFWSSYDKVCGIRQDLYIKQGWGATANLVVNEFIFRKVSGFDTSIMSGGDYEFCKKVTRELKIRPVFVKNLVVYHPARMTYNAIVMKQRRIIQGVFQKRGRRNLLYEFVSSLRIRMSISLFQNRNVIDIIFYLIISLLLIPMKLEYKNKIFNEKGNLHNT